MFRIESTEKSDTNNWVKNILLNERLKLLSFEGYTLKKNILTGLYDRAHLINNTFRENDSNLIYDQLRHIDMNLEKKINFVNFKNIPYRYVIYTYKPERIYVYRIINSEFILKKKYNSFKNFGQDLKKLTDVNVYSPLQIKEMPEIDIIMRALKTPWPVNLDGIFFNDQGCLRPAGLLEFQTTIKQSVREHCNNKWWQSIGNRKGDKGRWQVLDVLSKNLSLPIYIVVWSPKDIKGDVKFKLIEKIDNNGIQYKYKKIINYREYSGDLKKLLQPAT